MKHPSPGRFAVQFITDAPGRLDFVVRDANSFEDALGYAREAIATHPEFEWDGVLIWQGFTAADLQKLTEEMQEDQKGE